MTNLKKYEIDISGMTVKQFAGQVGTENEVALEVKTSDTKDIKDKVAVVYYF
jgi:hypothetical protein